MKFRKKILLLWVLFALLDPDSEYRSRSTNLFCIRIRNPSEQNSLFIRGFLIKSRHNLKRIFHMQELNSERLKNTDNLKIHEVVARATPTKNTEIKVSDLGNPEWFSPNPDPAGCGSVTLWNGSGSADPYVPLTNDPDPTPDTALDPGIFLSDLQDGNKKKIQVFLLISVWSYIYIIFQR